MTWEELKPVLRQHCEDMKNDMPGFLYYGVIKASNGEILDYSAGGRADLSQKITNETDTHLTIMRQVIGMLNNDRSVPLHLDFIVMETDKIIYIITITKKVSVFSLTGLEKSKANLGLSKNLLAKCAATFGETLDNLFADK